MTHLGAVALLGFVAGLLMGCASTSALQKAIGGDAGLSACIVIGDGMCQVHRPGTPVGVPQ